MSVLPPTRYAVHRAASPPATSSSEWRARVANLDNPRWGAPAAGPYVTRRSAAHPREPRRVDLRDRACARDPHRDDVRDRGTIPVSADFMRTTFSQGASTASGQVADRAPESAVLTRVQTGLLRQNLRAELGHRQTSPEKHTPD